MCFEGFCLCPYVSSETGEAALRILGASVDDSGVYTCVATNVAGSATSSASLRVSGEVLLTFFLHKKKQTILL